MSVTNKINELKSLKSDLATALNGKGVEAAATEGFSTLVPKVNDIDTRGSLETMEAFINRTVDSGMIEDLEYPNGVGSYAFYGCKNIVDFDFNSLLGKNGAEGAYSAYFSSGMKPIGKGAFAYTGIKNLKAYPVDKLEEGAFEGCKNLTGGLETLKNGSDYRGNFVFTGLYNGVIPSRCFKDASFESSNYFLIRGCVGSTFSTGVNVASVGEEAFMNTSVNFGSNIYGFSNIGARAFKNATFNIDNVYFWSKLSAYGDYGIGEEAFMGASVYLFANNDTFNYEGSKGAYIKKRAFANMRTPIYKIPNFSYFAEEVFSGTTFKYTNTNLFSYTSGTIGKGAFKNASFPANSGLSIGGYGYEVTIQEEAFYNITNMNSLSFPINSASIHIGERAFANNESLVSMYINPSGSEIKMDIAERAFENCTSLKNIQLKGVTKIGHKAFSNIAEKPLFTFIPNGGYAAEVSYSSHVYPPELDCNTVFPEDTIMQIPIQAYSLFENATNWGGIELSLNKTSWNNTAIVLYGMATSTDSTVLKTRFTYTLSSNDSFYLSGFLNGRFWSASTLDNNYYYCFADERNGIPRTYQDLLAFAQTASKWEDMQDIDSIKNYFTTINDGDNHHSCIVMVPKN